MSEQPEKPKRDWAEEIEVAGGELVERVKELVKEGNVRKLIIRDMNDKVLVEIPLATGFLIGGVVAFMSPLLAAVGAVAAVVTRVRIQVVREGDVELPDAPPAPDNKKRRIEILSEGTEEESDE